MKNTDHNNIDFRDLILFEDENYIVIDKPANISTLEDRKDEINILSLAREYHPEAIVNHRLDKETTGVLVLAKHEEAYRHLSVLFEKREVNKIYSAIVWGSRDFNDLLIEAPLYISGSGKVRIDPRGKYSATIVRTVKKYPKVTLVDCKILTGKKHQIRVHLMSAGHPLVHDDLYQGLPLYLSDIKRNYRPKDEREERPISRRLCLHSRKIEFDSPNGKHIIVESELPKDMKLILKQLDKNG